MDAVGGEVEAELVVPGLVLRQLPEIQHPAEALLGVLLLWGRGWGAVQVKEGHRRVRRREGGDAPEEEA